MKKQFLFLILFLAGYGGIVAQETSERDDRMWRLGVYGQFALNRYVLDVSSVLNPNSSGNSLFNGGEGTGIDAGFLVEKLLSPNIALSLRVGYESFAGNLVRYYISESENGSSSGMTKQTLRTEVRDIGFEPAVVVRFFDGGVLYGGMRIGYVLHHAVNGQYSDASVEGVTVESEIKESEFTANWHYLLHAGFGVEVPLTDDVVVMPEISYAYGLTDLWNTLGVRSCTVRQWRFGLALKYIH